MVEALLEEVVRLAVAFQHAANRDTLTSKDVLRALEIGSHPLPSLTSPGWKPPVSESTDLRSYRVSTETEEILVPSFPRLAPRLEGERWLLSVCVPRKAIRKRPLEETKPRTIMSAFSEIPATYCEAAKQSLEHLLLSWGSENVASHKDLLIKFAALPPAIIAGIAPVIGAVFSRALLSPTAPPPQFVSTGRALVAWLAEHTEFSLVDFVPGLVEDALQGARLGGSARLSSPLKRAGESVRAANALQNIATALRKRNENGLADQLYSLVEARIDGIVNEMSIKDRNEDVIVLFGLLNVFHRRSAVSELRRSMPTHKHKKIEEASSIDAVEWAVLRRRVNLLLVNYY